VTLANNDLYLIGRSLTGKLQAIMLGYVDRYVSLSRQITDEIRQLPLDFRRVVEIPVGVDVDRFTPADPAEKAALRARDGLPDGNLALYTGVLDRRKNVEWLVKTWAKHRTLFANWRLLLVGPPSRHHSDRHLAGALREYVRAEGLADRILFREFTPRIEDYYRAADLFVLPSKNEGMANVLLEAMTCGLPCVATRISGTTDLITHGKSGMLFEVGDEDDFLEAVSPILRDADLRGELGAHARARMVEEFSTAVDAQRYFRLYRELLEH
jgi:glycosyltransferase involved in cell wall biosynthesis